MKHLDNGRIPLFPIFQGNFDVVFPHASFQSHVFGHGYKLDCAARAVKPYSISMSWYAPVSRELTTNAKLGPCSVYLLASIKSICVRVKKLGIELLFMVF
jgi:hypothetical protein